MRTHSIAPIALSIGLSVNMAITARTAKAANAMTTTDFVYPNMPQVNAIRAQKSPGNNPLNGFTY